MRKPPVAGKLRYVSSHANLEVLLSSRYLFHCREAGAQLRDNERLAVDVSVGHLVMPGHPSVVEWAPPSLKRLYAYADGAALFCPDGTSIDNVGAHYGFILHSVDDVPRETEQLYKWLLADLEWMRDEFDTAEFDKAHQRISAFVAIGSKCSGDPVVLDRQSAIAGSEEVPVLLLDHELILAAALDDSGEMAKAYPDIDAWLTALHLDALTYLDDDWRYLGPPDGRQYYVDSIEHTT